MCEPVNTPVGRQVRWQVRANRCRFVAAIAFSQCVPPYSTFTPRESSDTTCVFPFSPSPHSLRRV